MIALSEQSCHDFACTPIPAQKKVHAAKKVYAARLLSIKQSQDQELQEDHL